MYDLYSIKDIKFLMEKYDFRFSKGLGQNFIINKNICPRMVSESEISNDTGVIEIGPGVGVLTCEIAKQAKKVVSVEYDKKLLPILKETTESYSNVKILNEDVLNLDINKLIQEEFSDFDDIKVCANLPYYITSDVVIKFLETESKINSLTFMVQKEAAQRICALPGTRKCGAISLLVQYYADAQILFGVSRGNFIPAPKVDSSVIKIKKNLKKSIKIENKENFFRVVRTAFSQRRKMILNSISIEYKIDKDILKNLLDECNIPVFSRPEELSFDDFINFSNSIYNRCV